MLHIIFTSRQTCVHASPYSCTVHTFILEKRKFPLRFSSNTFHPAAAKNTVKSTKIYKKICKTWIPGKESLLTFFLRYPFFVEAHFATLDFHPGIFSGFAWKFAEKMEKPPFKKNAPSLVFLEHFHLQNALAFRIR